MTRIVVNIKDWFTANKLSLNVEQTKYSFFHKPCKKDDILLRLPKRIINNYEIQRKESIKLLGILLDLTWKEHIKLTETKNTKNIGILYKARSYLDKKNPCFASTVRWHICAKFFIIISCTFTTS